MIIFGATAKHKTIKQGQFHCPQCQANRTYDLKESRRYFTLYFIPLIPLDRIGEFIECQTCHTTFKDDILDYKPKPRPLSATDLMNSIESRLHSGQPIELLIRDLTLANIDRDVAVRVVDSYAGEPRMKCPACSLTYASEITICAECNQSLQPDSH